ncbi:MAG: hypothetical protein ACYDBV_15385 [Nitrospiria bacterium]
MGRKNISIDQGVYDEFVLQAEKQNETLFTFANQALSLVSEVSAQGGTPASLKSIWRLSSILKSLDVMILPAEFVDDMIGNLYAFDRENLLRNFRKIGSNIVPLLKSISENFRNLSIVAGDLLQVLPVKKFVITPKEDGSIEVFIAGAGRRIESTHLHR